MLLALLALAGLGLVLWLGSSRTPGPGEPQEPAPPPSATGAGGVEAAPIATEVQRIQVAAGLAQRGSLRITATWGDDHAAAANVPLFLQRAGRAPFDGRRGVTDASGQLCFAGLVPGKYYVETRRGGMEMPVVAQVDAGDEERLTLRLPSGVLAQGIVVGPDDRPLAAALVVVSRWAEGDTEVLTETDATGRFRLRGLATHCGVGARARGYQPSPLQMLTADEGAVVELRVVVEGGGGGLHGRVLDATERPVPDAVVRCGERRRGLFATMPDGSHGMQQTPLQVQTDGNGEFALPSLPPGEQLLQARADGLAPWRGFVQVEVDRDAELIVRLQPGVTLRGSVRDDQQAPVPGAEVRAGVAEMLGFQVTRSADDGTYELFGLPVGGLPVEARGDRGGRSAATLQGGAGETLRWDVVLSRGLLLRGRVVGVDGEPAADVLVDAWLRTAKAGQSWGARERTAADGRFTLCNCIPGAPIGLAVFVGTPTFPVLRREVVPGEGELLLTLPPAAQVRIRGRVTGPDDVLLANVSLTPVNRLADSSPVATADAATGAFELGPYPAGDYSLVVEAPGYVRLQLPWRRLDGDEVWDVGALQLSHGGTLLARLLPPSPTPPVALRLWLLDRDGQALRRVEVQELSGRAGPLAAGDYILQVRGIDVACMELPVRILTGVETAVEVPLQACTAVDFDFAVADAATDRLRVEVRDAERRPVLRTDVWRRPDGFLLTAGFAPGNYELQVSTAGGETGEATITVDAGGRPRVEVKLRRK